jgi:MFS family permease
MSFEGNMVLSLTQNVTNTFGTNNLISLLPTVLYILQTALLPMYSKLSDMYGRAQCYSVALVFYIVAYIVMATAPDYFTIVVSCVNWNTVKHLLTSNYLGRSSYLCFWLFWYFNSWSDHNW